MRSIAQQDLLNGPRIVLDDLRRRSTRTLETCLLQPSRRLACPEPFDFHHGADLDALPWYHDAGDYHSYPVYYARLSEGFVSPNWGAVFTRDGDLVGDSVNAARWASPDLSAIPGLALHGEELVFTGHARRLPGRYILLNNWGSHNYGHFIIECLIGLLSVQHLLPSGEIKILSKPLTPWQTELLDVIGIGADQLHQSAEDLVQVDEAIFPSFLGGNLEHPSIATRVAFDTLKLRAGITSSQRPGRRLLIDRRAYPTRRVENWPEVERMARRLDFEYVATERLSVREQIALFADAAIVVGETGAALTNIGFCEPGTPVVEIMIQGRESRWIKNTSALLGRRWACQYERTWSTEQGLAYTIDTEGLQPIIERALSGEETRETPRRHGSGSKAGDLRILGCGHYRENTYAHVELQAALDGVALPVKVQTNGTAMSLEFRLDGLPSDMPVPAGLVEFDKVPLVRIYFGTDPLETQARLSRVSETLRHFIHRLAESDPQHVAIPDDAEATQEARTLFIAFQKSLKALKNPAGAAGGGT
ncbi:glycosyltransferase family 61 protein [Methylobacterium oryzisoli]|uniref:glycosyltransferase family 61 protein n=1 Tax=Methylobacterium oryzisoli TaxID=3385502 RepID=UPI00389279A0